MNFETWTKVLFMWAWRYKSRKISVKVIIQVTVFNYFWNATHLLHFNCLVNLITWCHLHNCTLHFNVPSISVGSAGDPISPTPPGLCRGCPRVAIRCCKSGFRTINVCGCPVPHFYLSIITIIPFFMNYADLCRSFERELRICVWTLWKFEKIYLCSWI